MDIEEAYYIIHYFPRLMTEEETLVFENDWSSENFNQFILKTAIRIEDESPCEYYVNRCPKCGTIARTPYAKQCRKCKNDWHKEIKGIIHYTRVWENQDTLWIIGKIINGKISVGNIMDLTNFELNLKKTINRIEDNLKLDNKDPDNQSLVGIRCADKNEEMLITKQLNTSGSKYIMILKQ